MENSKIFNVNKDDIKYIYAIEKNEINVPWSEDSLSKLIDDENVIFRVLKINNQVIGYYSFAKILDEGHINNVAIKREYQHQGYGSMLIEDMIVVSNNVGVKSLTLEVEVDNIAAIKLYEKYDFKNEGIRKKYYLNTYDAMIMWRR